ncbi:MAG: DinB family protein [Actinomycetota bacterium]|nr:DinB family protein [Actinomycetota bacterium]
MPFKSPVQRKEAPGVADERSALTAFLDFGRATLLEKMVGLDDEALRRPVAPSGLTLLGILKHAGGFEHWWFAINFAQTGEPLLYWDDDDPDVDMRATENETTEQLVDSFLRMCERSRQIVAEAPSLDQKVPNKKRGEVDLRWIMLHLIEEYARHNGHADIIRELIDGETGF